MYKDLQICCALHETTHFVSAVLLHQDKNELRHSGAALIGERSWKGHTYSNLSSVPGDTCAIRAIARLVQRRTPINTMVYVLPVRTHYLRVPPLH